MNRFRPAGAALAVLAAVALAAAPSRAGGGEGAEREHLVKAAFLYNFLKFAEWPAPSGAAALGELRIGILAGRSFAEAADKTLAGKTAKGLPVRVRRLEGIGQIAGDGDAPHLLFVEGAGKSREAIAAVAGRPVLTVGEGAEFCRQGGMIALVREGNRLRFEINQRAAERAGVRLSSKLLALARVVHGDGRP